MEMPREYLGNMAADKVLDEDGHVIGVATSRCYSLYFRQMISLCTIDVAYSGIGTEVTVVWGNPGRRQKQIRATVQRAPYKQDNRRMDVTALPSFV
jgi:vanillate/3-O-methylgallate O-demethylase